MQNVLFVAPKFFGYYQRITKEFEALGYQVDFVSDVPFQNTLFKAFLRATRGTLNFLFDRHYKNKIKSFNRDSYDLVLVINGESLSGELIKSISIKYKPIRKVYYLWDSVANKPNAKNLFVYFDSVSTFDPCDSVSLNIDYHPLFFIPPINSFVHPNEEQIDLSFVGTVHSDRLKIIDSITKNLPGDIVFYKYLYFQAKWFFILKFIFSPLLFFREIKFFKFQALPFDDLERIFSRSKVILDISHPSQNGLTMRTFEVLSSGKKLITTNKFVVNCDFYSKSNVLIFDRNKKFEIPVDFFTSPVSPIEPHIVNQYSLSSWLVKLMSFE